jgi:D-alanyl-D-alanine carboxypeptidase
MKTLSAVAAALALSMALSPVRAQEGPPPKTALVDDFESGKLADWKTEIRGAGGWFVYTNGKTPPNPAASDPNAPFQVPDPPQGKFAAVTDMNGPGTRILYRDLKLDGRYRLHLTAFYAADGELSSPETLAFDASGANQQYRIDLVSPSAPIDSLAKGDVLVNVFHTSPGGPDRLQPTEVSADLSPWAGQTVRLRLAGADNRGALRAGVDDIRLEPVAADAPIARIEPAPPPELEVARLTEAGALAAMSARGEELAKDDRFSGAVLVARHGKVLLQKGWGRANREAGTPVTVDTRFRIGSMNKMFTAVAAMQLVESGKLALDSPIVRYLPDYPNKDLASKVTVRHLLTHTGGTGDIFGPEFEKNRLTLREHGDYVKLYGSRALAFEPGARYEYSNYGFVLLGAILEKVSGRSYYDLVRSTIFKPAGMTSTDSLPETESVPNRSVGYMREGGAWVPNTETLPWRGTSAGGGYSTVGDLLRFATALESGKLISKAMLAEATTPHQEQYGYGFQVQSEGPARGYGHGGGAPGMNGSLRVYPQLGYVLVGLANLDPPAASRLVDYFVLRMPLTP